MIDHHKLLLSFCLVVGFVAITFADKPPESPAAEKALGYLTAEGVKWIDKQGCVSCHQIPAMLWSLNAADRYGLELPQGNLESWNAWATDPASFVKPAQREELDVEKTLAGNIDTMAALMLAVPAEKDAIWRDQFAAKLCSEQAEDGSWNACGQLPAQRRPKQETNQATTLWVTLALLRHGNDDFDLASAIRFSDDGPDATSTEWHAVRMLVAAELDDPSFESFRTQLLGLQNDDGGWGWITDQPSDALATGIALYALAESGETQSHSIAKARQFLTTTQQESGNWLVPGTKTSAKRKPTSTSNYWGSAWAVVGLLSTEPVRNQYQAAP